MEEEKQRISILVELVLYPRIRMLGEDGRMTKQTKEKITKQAIEIFVQECMNEYESSLPEEEIRKTVNFVLNRTINNTKRNNEER